MATKAKSAARKRMNRRYPVAAPAKEPRVEEGSVLEEISVLRGQVERIGGRLLELEGLQIARQRDAARTNWSPNRGTSWKELRAIMAEHGLFDVAAKSSVGIYLAGRVAAK